MSASPALKVLVVPPDDRAYVKVLEPDANGSHLAALQALVGGYIEGIDGNDPEHGRWEGFVNEEGRIFGLPRNVLGSLIAAGAGWHGGGLVGPVVFTGVTDGNGDSTSVADWLVEAAGVSDGVAQPG